MIVSVGNDMVTSFRNMDMIRSHHAEDSIPEQGQNGEGAVGTSVKAASAPS
jgi:hypothetical protein